MTTVPFFSPGPTDKEVEEAVLMVLRSGRLSNGYWANELESSVASCLGFKHALAVNSCTSALQIAIQAHKIKGEVVVPAFTWVAVSNAVLNAGAIPAFCDSSYKTGNPTEEMLEQAIGHDTEAVIATHYAGIPSDLGAYKRLAAKHHLLFIEDAADALGSTYDGTRVGSWGQVTCLSFGATKAIPAGEGGMLLLNEEWAFHEARSLSNQGQDLTFLPADMSPREVMITKPGFNMRMTDLHAVVAVILWPKLEEFVGLRLLAADVYREHLSSEFFDFFEVSKTCRWSPQIFPMKLKPGLDRKEFINMMGVRGVGCAKYYSPLITEQPYYISRGFNSMVQPEARALSKDVVCLPLYPGLGGHEIMWVINQANEAASILTGKSVRHVSAAGSRGDTAVGSDGADQIGLPKG